MIRNSFTDMDFVVVKNLASCLLHSGAILSTFKSKGGSWGPIYVGCRKVSPLYAIVTHAGFVCCNPEKYNISAGVCGMKCSHFKVTVASWSDLIGALHK